LRAARSRLADVVVIATTDCPQDDAVAAEAQRLDFPWVRGSEDDVLSRYHLAATKHSLDIVCRITADCPFIDPEVVDAAFWLLFEGRHDYASNTLRRSFPRGLDAEVFRFEALDRAHQEATDLAEREHVTPHIYRNPTTFSLGSLEHEEDLSANRWTVDQAEDLLLAREIIKRLPPEDLGFSYHDILAVLAAEPELAEINAHVEQKKIWG
jgi:spore coat polysaccharide biosynthesis protein SpsF